MAILKSKEKVASEQVVPEKKIEQVLVRKDRVEQKKKEGFKVIGNGKDKRNRILGIKSYHDDLVLMEKTS